MSLENKITMKEMLLDIAVEENMLQELPKDFRVASNYS